MVSTLNRANQITEISKTDARLKRIAGAISKQQRKPDALIEILHMAQDLYGFLPLNLIVYIARELKIPPSRAFGVVTFYHFFTLKPKGEHNCLICTGTACYVKGAQSIIDQVSKDFSINPGETTKDNKLGLQTARCLGACGLAPAVVFDNEILAKVNPSDISSTIRNKIGEVK